MFIIDKQCYMMGTALDINKWLELRPKKTFKYNHNFKQYDIYTNIFRIETKKKKKKLKLHWR